ncbi:MAG: hypothetical protein HZA51_16610 [Planctomycetes bacterium]|nr:hypothetical protein [Planctomycetota bacterium]
MTRTLSLTLILAIALPARAGDLKPTRIALFNSGVGFFEAASLEKERTQQKAMEDFLMSLELQ